MQCSAHLVLPEGEGHAAREAHGADLVHGAGDRHVLIVVPAVIRPVHFRELGREGTDSARRQLLISSALMQRTR